MIKDTHGKTSHLAASDIDALTAYLKSLDRENAGAISISPPASGGGDGGPTPTPTPSSIPSPTISPRPSASPTATVAREQAVAARPLNLSTRGRVGLGDDAMIGGFIITGTTAKRVVLRAVGPSLTEFGVAGALQDPALELRSATGELIARNDNWRDNPDEEAAVRGTGFAPRDDHESALLATLAPGSYTAAVSGHGGRGAALIELYDLDQAGEAQLANISTRGVVQSGDDVIAGQRGLEQCPPKSGARTA
ncbi:MAG: hypothetical protein M3Z64_03565 [Verrucomicrobiota bacterium]|nr:hypothetical protein [Verrucomicrobiota bacterium]